MKRKFVAAVLIGVMGISALFTGCDSKSAVIPEDIISKATSINENSTSYYGEAKMETYENEKIIYSANLKEWYKPKNKKRVEIKSDNDGETIMTSDGSKMLIYMKKLNKAMVSDKINDEEGFFDKSPKKAAMDELGRINKTHSVEIKGEENLNGRKAYHLYAKPKGKDSIIGEVNYWIDKDTWFIVKTSVITGNSKTTTEYTKLDFKADISDDIFNQSIPKDVKIENIDESMKPEKITLEKASKELGTKVLYYNNSDYKLSRVETLKNNPEIGDDFNQIYTSNNGAEIFTLTMKKVVQLSKDDGDFKLPGEKKITIRGKEGSAIEEKAFKSVHWVEDGLNYSIFTTSPNFSLGQCKGIAEKLTYSK